MTSFLDDIANSAHKVKELEGRVTALERSRSQASEPSYQTVSPSGLVTSNFTGSLTVPPINASGIRLPASPFTNLFPIDDVTQVEWTRMSDGALVAGVGAATTLNAGISNNLQIIYCTRIGSQDTIGLDMLLATQVDGTRALISMQDTPGFTPQTSIFVQAGNVTKKLLDSTGATDF